MRHVHDELWRLFTSSAVECFYNARGTTRARSSQVADTPSLSFGGTHLAVSPVIDIDVQHTTGQEDHEIDAFRARGPSAPHQRRIRADEQLAAVDLAHRSPRPGGQQESPGGDAQME
jgi:hypothetical protein